MWGNDTYGDCAEVAMCNQQVQFEITEQSLAIPLTTAQVLQLYHNIAGPGDVGTVYLNAMKYWRNVGIKVTKTTGCIFKKENSSLYLIDAFASVDWHNLDEVKAAIYLLNGLQVGVQLPWSADDQWKAGLPWTLVSGSPLMGGHGLYFGAFDDAVRMFGCYTWGTLQLVDYDWFVAQVDETYAVVDAKNSPDSPVDTDKLNGYLAEITK
jgi:hypothetical protein